MASLTLTIGPISGTISANNAKATNIVTQYAAARQYGRDYFVGDLVSSYWEGVSATKQLIRATVTVENSISIVETIKLETENA